MNLDEIEFLRDLGDRLRARRVERGLTQAQLAEQSGLWTIGFAVLLALIACASLLALRAGAAEVQQAKATPAAPLTARQILKFIGLAFVPSGLLVAVTAQLSTDVAAAPLLWVLPLALFLLTFVLAFRDKPLLAHAAMLKLQPFLVGLAIVLVAAGALFNMFVAIALMLATYFVCAMVAHGELFRLRPPASQLTSFYLWMSVGGVLGGIFAALLAPLIFSTVLEYPVLLVAAMLCRPAPDFSGKWRVEALSLLLGGVFLSLPALLGILQLPDDLALARFILITALAVAIAISGRHKGRVAGLAAAALMLALAWQTGAGRVTSVRSFFGVHKIADSQDGRLRILYHGTTVHGGQRLANEDGSPAKGKPERLTYYYEGGVIDQAISSARAAHGGKVDVAVVGLGSGTLACAAAAGENWRFFEIDPEIIRIARDPQKFRFLSACQPDAAIVAGDARLTLAADAGTYDLVVLDAFSSDSIPVHLLTREAIQLYLSRLKPGGSLLLHISNRHMQLAEVVAAGAGDLGLSAWLGKDSGELKFDRDFHAHATAAVIAKNDADLGPLTASPHWAKMQADPAVRVWTDDYSNILQAIWRRINN